MQVTDIRIITVDRGALRAYVNITFDDCFVVNDFEIIEAPNGLFLAMPAQELSDGTRLDIFSPADTRTARQLEELVIAEYTMLLSATTLTY